MSTEFFSPKYLTHAFEILDQPEDRTVVCGGLTHLLRYYEDFPLDLGEAPARVVHVGDIQVP